IVGVLTPLRPRDKTMSATTHLMTAEELVNLPDDGNHYELIKGELLTMPPPGNPHGTVGMNLSILLGLYVKTNNLGRAFSEMGYRLESDPDTVLAPDISFIARDILGVHPEGYRSVAPDLAVEVLSPGDRKTQVERKTSLWLELGAKSVWNVNPRHRTVEVCRSNGERKLFHETDELVDDTVPGFRVKVSEIFA
ncbi:MAG TPA: Uma2 family endonuclease, partial [Pyrinomonadaceae bacterium]|nr:Uma2 family endonuclease [Pyrinomonadaceae bacterium]